MRVIAVFNHKGGVGKTTSVVNLGAALARKGYRVLLIDCDPQACLTVHLGVDLDNPGGSFYEVMTRDMPMERAVRGVGDKGEETLLLVPSHLDLAGAELELATAMGRERILRDALDRYLRDEGELDYVFLDCPPSLGLLTVNALTATDEVFVPLQTEYLALRGVGKLIEVITLVRRRLNPEIQITGILPTLSRTGTLLAREVQEEIERHFGPKVFKTRIRSNVRLAEAPSHGKSIFAYDPRSKGAEDYLALAEEVDAMQVTGRRVIEPEPAVQLEDLMAPLEPPQA
ncbi:MAG: ParA family protein [Planctomycetota bacterium]